MARCFTLCIAGVLCGFAARVSAAAAWQDPDVGSEGILIDDRGGKPESDDAVLVIDGQPISSREFGMWLIRTQGERSARDFAESYFVVDREAKRLGTDVSDDEVSKAVEADFAERIRGAFFGRKEDWLRELDRTGRTESGLRVQRNVEYRPYLQARAIANINRVVPEEKIVREWQRIYGRNGRHYELLMMKFKVAVPTYPGATRDEWRAEREARMKEQRDKAESVRRRLIAGEDFGKLAAQFSDDPDTRGHEGSPSDGFSHVGWFASFMDGLEKLALGEISEPMYARGGYWLVKVLAVDETPLERVRAQIVADLERKGPEPDEIGAVQTRLKENVSVKVLPTMYTEREGREWPSAYEPALEIDGEPVRRGTYARWIRDTLGETFVRLFVEERAVESKARELGVSVSEDEVDRRARERVQYLIDTGHKASRESWRTYLALGGRTEDSFLRDMAWRTRVDLLAEKMMMRDRKVTSEEVRARFADAYGSEGQRIEVRLIVCLPRMDDADPDWSREELIRRMSASSDAARARALALAARARGGEDFAALARESSDDPTTREQGGKAKERFRADVWNDEVAGKVLALKQGEISDPIEFGGAWFVFQVTQIRTVTFEQVEKELAEELQTRIPSDPEVTGYRNSLLQQASYKVLPAMSK